MRNEINTKPSQAGAVLIEFSLTLLCLTALMVITLELASAISEYKLIMQRVGMAARYYSTQPPATGSGIAHCLIAYGRLTSCSASGRHDGFVRLGSDCISSCATVNVDDAVSDSRHMKGITIGSASVNLVRVSVTGYSHRLLLGDELFNFQALLDPNPKTPVVVTAFGEIPFGSISMTVRQAN